MSRLSIVDLGRLGNRWRVDKHSRGFESLDAAAAEDSVRARKLRKETKDRSNKRKKRLLALADLLDPQITASTPPTLASFRHMRDLRKTIISHVWKAVADDRTGTVARFDVIKPAWAFERKELKRKKPAQLLGEFRADILRAAAKVIPGGAAKCSGFLIAFLHGEFESEAKLFQLHWHLIATGNWVQVVDRLRGMKSYLPTERVSRPVRKRRGLRDLAYTLTYLLKSYWPGKWRGYVSGQDGKRRRRKHGRIPEPYHSDALQWLHRNNIRDLTLLMNVRVGKGGLTSNSVHQ